MGSREERMVDLDLDLKEDVLWLRRARTKYWEEINKSDGFDVPKGLGLCPDGFGGLAVWTCDDRFPCNDLVILYAKMGLHRYNLLEGTNYQLYRVEKYNYSTGSAARSYYITLVAHNPFTSKYNPFTSKYKIFQTRVNEKSYGNFILMCYTARPRGQTSTLPKNGCLKPVPDEWPLENPFENTKLFYVLKESELQVNDWIRLYLELAVATTYRGRPDYHLSSLEIVKVAIKNTKEEASNINATLYISYKDLCEDRVGKEVDRVAIITRKFDGQCFSLVGQNKSSAIIPKKELESECPLSSPQALAAQGIQGPSCLVPCTRRNVFVDQIIPWSAMLFGLLAFFCVVYLCDLDSVIRQGWNTFFLP